jgi:hypothetical protein
MVLPSAETDEQTQQQEEDERLRDIMKRTEEYLCVSGLTVVAT